MAQLVLVAAAGPHMQAVPGRSGGVPPEVFDGFLQSVRADRAAFLTAFAGNFFYRQPSQPYLDAFVRDGMQASPFATAECITAFRSADLDAEAATIRIPVHVFHGKFDRAVPYTQAAEWQKAIPQARLVTFDNAGHALFHDEAEKFVNELLRVVQGR